MLPLGRFADAKVLLHELLLQDVPLGDSLIMMIQHAEPVFDLGQLLLRETLDVARFEHLHAFVRLVEEDATCVPTPEARAVTQFGSDLLGGVDTHVEFPPKLRILRLCLVRLAVSAFEVRQSIRGQVDLVSIRDQLEEGVIVIEIHHRPIVEIPLCPMSVIQSRVS